MRCFPSVLLVVGGVAVLFLANRVAGFSLAPKKRNAGITATARLGTSLRLFGKTKRDNKDSSSSNNQEHRPHVVDVIPRMTTVRSRKDFDKFLQEDDRLVVVKFHAAWCKSCQKFGVKYHHLALEKSDLLDADSTVYVNKQIIKEGHVVKPGKVRFASVELSRNAKLCRSLGIKKLPSVHFYKGDIGQLAAFSCGPSKFQQVIDHMEEFLATSDEQLLFDKNMEEGAVLGNTILMDLPKEPTASVMNGGGNSNVTSTAAVQV